jgi:hypothetical protein
MAAEMALARVPSDGISWLVCASNQARPGAGAELAMAKPLSEEQLQRQTKRASLQEERLRQAEQRVADEKERVEATAAKTARLRGLREARDKAQNDADALAARPIPPTKKRRTSKASELTHAGKARQTT